MVSQKRIKADQRRIATNAFQRWKAFQVDPAMRRGAEANRDGSIPRPRIAPSTPAQRERFKIRERQRVTFESVAYRELRHATERQIGATLDFVDLPPDEQALKAGRPVVRLVTLGAAGIIPEGFATGFLVAPDVILTNHHVFRDREEARGVGAQFLYERTTAGIREGLLFELEPDRFFLNDRSLDFAFVAVKRVGLGGAALSQFKYLPLIGNKGKSLKGDPVNIIQHPEGGPKRYAIVNNQLLDLRDDGFLLYETDTLEGSSGSPVFNQHWETIGLHHCGVPQMESGMLVTRDGRRVDPEADVADSDLMWIANEGVRVSAIVERLSFQRLDRPAEQQILEGLLSCTVDPLSLVTEEAPIMGATLGAPAISATASTPMASNIFQFTGPVTIVVGTTVPQPAMAIAPVAALPAPATAALAEPEPEFPEKKLKFDEDYGSRTDHGYQPDFLAGWEIPAPGLTSAHPGRALLDGDRQPWEIPYYHYSLVMNRDRRLLAWAASNVDYSEKAREHTKSRKEYGGENWRLDPRVALAAPGLQIEDVHFYRPAKKIDRGHIVRREDGAWGTSSNEAEFGNSDTYHWTNCTPQSEAFNQSKLDGIWGQFEVHIQKEVGPLGGRMVVFAGPVLNEEDPTHGYGEEENTIQVPMEYWKIVLCTAKERGKVVRLAYGFVFDQTEPVKRLGYERMNVDDYETFQMPISEITRKTGIAFDQSVLQADVLKGRRGDERVRGFEGRRLRSVADVVLRGEYERGDEDFTGLIADYTSPKGTPAGRR